MKNLKWTSQESTKKKWTVDGKYGEWLLLLTLTKTPNGVHFCLEHTRISKDPFWQWDTLHEEDMPNCDLDGFTKQEALKKARGLVLSPMEYLASELKLNQTS
jgi:hypothetical protein